MRKARVILVVLCTVVGTSMGAAFLLAPDEEGAGNLELAIGDVVSEEITIDSLTVTFSSARLYDPDEEGWTETVLDDTPVDLVQLDATGRTTIASLSLEDGVYTGMELKVDDATGRVNGEEVEVLVPSGEIRLEGQIPVLADSTTGYAFDLTLVQRDAGDAYDLLPFVRDGDGRDSGTDGDGESEDEGEDGNDDGGAAKGQLKLAIGKSRTGVDDFDHLNVTFYKARVFVNNTTESNWTEMELDDVTVDLTNLTSTNETIVANLSLDAGNYTKVELYVSKVVGIVDGEPVEVIVPSWKLKIVGDFEVNASETLEFTFDIHVVQRGHKAVYNLLPVIAKNQGDGDDDD